MPSKPCVCQGSNENCMSLFRPWVCQAKRRSTIPKHNRKEIGKR